MLLIFYVLYVCNCTHYISTVVQKEREREKEVPKENLTVRQTNTDTKGQKLVKGCRNVQLGVLLGGVWGSTSQLNFLQKHKEKRKPLCNGVIQNLYLTRGFPHLFLPTPYTIKLLPFSYTVSSSLSFPSFAIFHFYGKKHSPKFYFIFLVRVLQPFQDMEEALISSCHACPLSHPFAHKSLLFLTYSPLFSFLPLHVSIHLYKPYVCLNVVMYTKEHNPFFLSPPHHVSKQSSPPPPSSYQIYYTNDNHMLHALEMDIILLPNFNMCLHAFSIKNVFSCSSLSPMSRTTK